MRDFADTAPAMLWVTDPDGSCTFLSRGWYEFTGQQEAEGLGSGWTKAVHPEDRKRAAEVFFAAIRRQEPFTLDYRLRRSDGVYRWAIDAGQPRFAPGGEFLGYVGSVIDVHERKEAEQSLRESEERFRLLADSAPALIWVNGPDGAEFVNRGYLDFLGVHPPDIRGYDWAQFVHPDDRERYLAAYLRAVENRTLFDAEFRFRRHDGEYRWMRSVAQPRIGVDGTFRGYSGISIDITDRKLAEETRREQDRRKDEFLATLSHELRNPLAPLRTGLHLLRLTKTVDPAVAPVHEMMERQVNHLVRLVDDLLEMSRITRGTFELRRERVELATVVRNARETAEPVVRVKGHLLNVSLPEVPVWLEGDPVRLSQIVANLLDNAAKYSPVAGRIDLSARRDGDHVVLSVRDDGIGIAAEDLPWVFDLFSRGEGSSGLGVGLALARRLAEMHGGTLTVSSEGRGKGAEFTLTLPVAQGVLPEPPAGGDDSGPPLPPRILVVDDNRDAADTLAILLRLMGTEVEVAYDGPAALARFDASPPAVVLLDIGMPEMDGYQVARAIRARPGGADVSLVALTGWGQERDREEAREAGFDHHLVKPVDPRVLEGLLASLVNGRRG